LGVSQEKNIIFGFRFTKQKDGAHLKHSTVREEVFDDDGWMELNHIVHSPRAIPVNVAERAPSARVRIKDNN
jgi:hypothetical protein